MLTVPNLLMLLVFPLLTMLIGWGGLTLGMLQINRRGRRAAQWATLLGIVVLIFAHQQIFLASGDHSPLGAYQSVFGGLLIWAWHEQAFYSGLVAGPSRRRCPPGARGWARFRAALATHLYHEIAVALELLLLVFLLRDRPNWLALFTVLLCWAMQHSARLNVLFGVRHLDVTLFPSHLRYLGSYWHPATSNAFFWPSSLVIAIIALISAIAASQAALEQGAVGYALIAVLASLGLIEHMLLLLPPRQVFRVGEAATTHHQPNELG